MKLLPLLFVVLPTAIFAGIGGSVVSLRQCAPGSLYQSWEAKNNKLQLVGDVHPLWNSQWCLSTTMGIGSIGSLNNSGLYTSPCGDAFPVTLSSGGALTLTDGSGLCVTVPAPGALPGVMLHLTTCASPVPAEQSFSIGNGVVTHAPSGLCIDAGTRVKACEGASESLPFCNTSLTFDARVADLISRLSFDEKVAMLATPSGGSPAVGVSPMQWWQEGLHGLANNLGTAFDGSTAASTSFPQPITSSQSFNRSMWLSTGRAISDEVRAFANAGNSGLSLWSPNINNWHDVRWGRIQEVSETALMEAILRRLSFPVLTTDPHLPFFPGAGRRPLFSWLLWRAVCTGHAGRR
jgi:hypothetical protein